MRNFKINRTSLKNEFDYEYNKFLLKMDQLQYLYSYQLYQNEINPSSSLKLSETQESTIDMVKKESLKSKRVDSENFQNDKLNEEVNRIDRMNSKTFKDWKNQTEEKQKSEINEVDNAECKVCKRKKGPKLPMEKCYSDYCENIFCRDCYQRNSYQARGSTCKCSYWDCDFCGNKKICIISTILCNFCDKRMCSDCYISQHQSHGSVKVLMDK